MPSGVRKCRLASPAHFFSKSGKRHAFMASNRLALFPRGTPSRLGDGPSARTAKRCSFVSPLAMREGSKPLAAETAGLGSREPDGEAGAPKLRVSAFISNTLLNTVLSHAASLASLVSVSTSMPSPFRIAWECFWPLDVVPWRIASWTFSSRVAQRRWRGLTQPRCPLPQE
jgi:hypothetical protein